MKIKTLIVLLTGLFFVLPLKIAGQDQVPEPEKRITQSKRILVLNSYHQGYSWTDKIMDGVFSVLGGHNIIKLHVEYMDTKRKSDNKYFLQLYDIYKHKFDGLKFDAIVSSDDHALDFLLRFRDKLYPGTPVFFCGINDFHDRRISSHKLFTGVVEEYDVAGTLNLILKLHPDASMIAVVSDHSRSGKATSFKTRRVAASFKDRIRFKYLTNLPRNELKKNLAELPDDAIILYITYLRTPGGTSLSIEESTTMVLEAGNLPVYCYWDYILGNGVMGGKVISAYYQGKTAALMAQDFLNGEDIGNMPVVKDSPNVFMFDYHALKKIKIDETSLPAGSIILEKPFGLYEKYKKTIWLIGGLILLHFFAIFYLIMCIIRRHYADKELLIEKEKSEESEAKLRAILNYCPALVSIKDIDENVILVNDQFKILEWPPPENYTGKNFSHLFSEDDLSRIDFTSLKSLVPEETEEVLKHRDGTMHPYSTVKFPVSNNSGKEFGICSISIDITERKIVEYALQKANNDLEKRVEERTGELVAANRKLESEIRERRQIEDQMNFLVSDLKRANQELQDFSYIVSHDLKAPMRGISSLVNWIREDYDEVFDENGRDYLDKLQNRTHKMHNLIEDILRYSRIGRASLEPEQFKSIDVIHDVLDRLSPPGSVTVNIREPLPDIMFDKTMFIQVIQNLISNGINHLGKPEGRITVSCVDLGESWEFCVEDNGAGIEERHFEKIFKIFQSLKSSSDTLSTGIGLSLVKKIIERSGGTVRVESTVGKGSAFFFTVQGSPRLNPMNHGSTVLVIDDNADFLEVETEMLELKNCMVLSAQNGEEAFGILESHKGDVDAALMDVHIPGEDAVSRYETLRTLRPDMKIILCTGNVHLEDVKNLQKKGADKILTKPFKADDFFDMLEKTIKLN